MRRLNRWGMVVACVWACQVGACDWRTNNPLAPASITKVAGGQAVLGSVEVPPTEISASAQPNSNNNSVFPGVSNKLISGVVGPNASAVAIGIPGDSAYWLVPAPTKDTVNADYQLFSTRYSISPELAASPLVKPDGEGKPSLQLYFRAVDPLGKFGEATILSLEVVNHAPVAALEVTLEWDAPVDLDLHVLIPASNGIDTVEVWSKMPTGAKQGLEGAALDMDSNAGCQIDNHNREILTIRGIPHSGHYIVRVEPYSLCGQFSAAWHATAQRADMGEEPIQEASGILTSAANRTMVGQGAGITAFEFDYP